MKKYGIAEALIMLVIGISGIILTLSSHYDLLMNEKFRYLSLFGFVMMLIMGVFALTSPQRQPKSNTLMFVLMIVLVIIGKPYVLGEGTKKMEASVLQAGLWDQIDQEKYPRQVLQDLTTNKTSDFLMKDHLSFTTIGIVKRLDELDEHSSIAIMDNFMYCCLADMIGIGLRVPCENPDDFEDGQWIMVSGQLVEEDKEIELPNFRFGNATISSIAKEYYLQPDKIMTYSRQDQLPLLSEQISTGAVSDLFIEALERTGLMEELEKNDPLTVFVPVNQAIEDLETPLDKMSKREFKNFVRKHMIKGTYTTTGMYEIDQLKTMHGNKVDVNYVNGKIIINQSRLLFENVEAQNGVIHYIYPAL